MVFGHSTYYTGGHFSVVSPQAGEMLLVFQAELKFLKFSFNYRTNQITLLVFCGATSSFTNFLLHLPLNTVSATSVIACHLYKYSN